jgi:hypothetical protein
MRLERREARMGTPENHTGVECGVVVTVGLVEWETGSQLSGE